MAVTDERGVFRLPVRVGTYRVMMELQGFANVAERFEALVGQTLTLNVQMKPSTVQESVTVTGEAPLIQTTSSTLAGNIDPRQTKDLPVNGGNWLDLSLLAPGNRSNGADPNTPTARNRFDYQLNIDGQQVTNNGRAGAANPRVSQEAVGEFQFVASRWDASQGRSNGVLVNAVTKSGTNTNTGSFSASFRNARFNSPDFVQQRVLPYSNQRFNGTYGGPIRKDRAHYFVYYEREREPSTITFNSPYPSFNVDQKRDVLDWNGGTRLDFQMGAQQHLMIRATKWIRTDPAYAGLNGATSHPSAQGYSSANADTLFATFSKVLGNRGLNEIKGGFTGAVERNRSVVDWPHHPQAAIAGVTNGAPRINFNGYSFGNNNTNWPQTLGQQVASLREDFTYSFNRAGRHDVKTGGEYLNTFFYLYNCRPCVGIYDASTSRPPANIQQLMPVWNNPDTWNLNALNPLIRLVPDRHRRVWRQRAPQHRRHVDPGRLADDEETHTEPRVALRPAAELVREFRRGVSDPERRPSGREKGLRPQGRLCVHAQRPHRDSRRRWTLLRPGDRQPDVVYALGRDDIRRAGVQ